jgi:hypothetical protein
VCCGAVSSRDSLYELVPTFAWPALRPPPWAARLRVGDWRRAPPPPLSGPQASGGIWALPNSLGCSLDPFPFASATKCHQKSTCNSTGSSVGFLAPPPGHRPPHRWAIRPCRASTSLAPLYSPRARLSFGWGSKPPSRSVLAPAEPPRGP